MATSRREFLNNAAALTALTSLMLLPGCGPIGSSRRLRRVVLQVDGRVTGRHAPFYLGVTRRWYEAEGIELVVNEASGPLSTAQLVASEPDVFGLIDCPSAIHLIAQGLPIRCVATAAARSPLGLIVRQHSDVRTPKDLEGRTLVLTTGEAATQLWPPFVSAVQLDINKVKVLYLDGAARVPFIVERRADAMVGTAEDSFALEAHGVPTLTFPLADYGINLVSLGIFVSMETMRQVGFVKQVLRIVHKCFAGMQDSKGVTAALDAMRETNPHLDRLALQRQWQAFSHLLRSPACAETPILYSCPGDWQRTLHFMSLYLGLKTAMRAEDFFTNGFLPAR